MPILEHNCPHCGINKAAFIYIGSQRKPNDINTYTAFFCCPQCNGGIGAEIYSGHSPADLPGSLNKIQTENRSIDIRSIYPKNKVVEAPPHVPENIANKYKEAQKNLHDSRWDSAGIMFRKALEFSIKELSPDSTGKLKNLIDDVEKKGLITSDMKNWAHEIRGLGNDAAHEEFTEGDAKDIASFTELFLTYVFTLPGKLSERRKQQNF